MVTGSTHELAVHITFDLKTLRENPFDFLAVPLDLKLPVEFADALHVPFVPYLARATLGRRP